MNTSQLCYCCGILLDYMLDVFSLLIQRFYFWEVQQWA